VKETFQGFDDVSDDRRAAAVFLIDLLVFNYSCLFILRGVQQALFRQFVNVVHERAALTCGAVCRRVDKVHSSFQVWM